MNEYEPFMSLSAQLIADMARHQPEMLHSYTLSPLSAAQGMEVSRAPAVDIALVGGSVRNFVCGRAVDHLIRPSLL